MSTSTHPDRLPRPAAPLVACIILNTNRRDDTVECVGSVLAGAYRNVLVIVLDCQSTDGSVEAIRARFPQVLIVPLEDNLGYAGNNNVGLRLALDHGADWVFVLNEDTVLAPETIAALVEAGAHDPDIGIVGPTVYHHDEPGVIQSAGGRLSARWEECHVAQNEPDTGRFREPRQVDWISGCALLVSRAVIDAIGGLDDRYFIYWEETEWCIRATRAGWRIVHVPAARVWHKGVQRDHRPRPSVTYYSTRNRLLTLWKHRAPLSARVTAWAQILRTLLSWTLRPKWRGKRDHRDAMWQGIHDYWRGRWGRMPN